MSQGLITESYLTAIANAIRSKTNTTQTFTPAQMASAIDAIATGISPKEVLEGTASLMSNTYVDNETTKICSGFYAFNSQIRQVTFNVCTTIGASAFYYVGNVQTGYGLNKIAFPVCTTVGPYAFYHAKLQCNLSFPELLSLSSHAFEACQGTSMKQVYMPKVRSIAVGAFSACRFLTSVDITNCTAIEPFAFYYDSSTTAPTSVALSITMPACVTIDSAAFYRRRLTSLNIPQCVSIGQSVFASGVILGPSVLSLSKCTYIGTGAFSNCTGAVTEIYLPLLTSLFSSVFNDAFKSTLVSINLPQCTSVYHAALAGHSVLQTISLPVCTLLSQWAIASNAALSNVNFPEMVTIGNQAFRSCSSLASVILPKCTLLSSDAFLDCRALSYIRLAESATGTLKLSYAAFKNCYNLLSLYLLGSTVATLYGTNVFSSTPISNYTTSTGGVYGSIFVRASLLTTYQTAQTWSTYANRFVGLTDAQIAALDT